MDNLEKTKYACEGISGAVLITAAVLTFFLPCWRRYGATNDELHQSYPGDDIVKNHRGGYTHAITIQAPRRKVWQWLVQIGQGRGGFYSYDFLENLVGCDIHSANEIIEEYQEPPVEGIRLHPKMPPIPLVITESEKFLLFAGGPTPDTMTSWLFFLEETEANSIRLISRWSYTHKGGIGNRTGYDVILQSIACIMQRKMLQGIKKRATGNPG